MEDKRLEKRKKFLDPVVDKRKDRDKFMVSLRKKTKQDIFMNNRKRIMQERQNQVTQEFVEFESILKAQIPTYDSECRMFDEDFMQKFAFYDMMSVFKRFMKPKIPESANFLSKLLMTSNIDYVEYIISPENMVFEYIQDLFSLCNCKVYSSKTSSSEFKITDSEDVAPVGYNAYSESNNEAIQNVFYICNNIGSTEGLRDWILKTSYFSKLHELIFESNKSYPLEVYKTMAWSMSVICNEPITVELAKVIFDCGGIPIDLSHLTEDQAEEEFLDYVFEWLLMAIQRFLVIDSKTIRRDIMKAIANLTDHQDLGDKFVQYHTFSQVVEKFDYSVTDKDVLA